MVLSLPNESNRLSQLASKSRAVGRSSGLRERHFMMDRLSMRSLRSLPSRLAGSSHGSGLRPVSWSKTSSCVSYRSKSGSSVNSSYAMTPSAHMSTASSTPTSGWRASYAINVSGAAYRGLKLRLASVPARLPRSRHLSSTARVSVSCCGGEVRTDLARAAKVDEGPLEVLRPPENVAGLEVSMRDASIMQPLQARRHVAEHLHSPAALDPPTRVVRSQQCLAATAQQCSSRADLKDGWEVWLNALGPLVKRFAALDDDARRERPAAGAADGVVRVGFNHLDRGHHIPEHLIRVECVFALKRITGREELDRVVLPVMVASRKLQSAPPSHGYPPRSACNKDEQHVRDETHLHEALATFATVG